MTSTTRSALPRRPTTGRAPVSDQWQPVIFVNGRLCRTSAPRRGWRPFAGLVRDWLHAESAETAWAYWPDIRDYQTGGTKR